jgi:hypothetical protein
MKRRVRAIMVMGSKFVRPRDRMTGHSKKLMKPRAMINRTARFSGKARSRSGTRKLCHCGLQPGDQRKKMTKVRVVKITASRGDPHPGAGEAERWKSKGGMRG